MLAFWRRYLASVGVIGIHFFYSFFTIESYLFTTYVEMERLETMRINVTYINDIGAPVFTGSSSIADFFISSSGGGISADGFILTKG
tara:strand:- start:315 stop:575 length:261 start_codon:yes stop_codon:yes gene_type:complete